MTQWGTELTSLGPVLASFHSGAVELMRSRGSSHETPKYIEMDTVCNEEGINIQQRE